VSWYQKVHFAIFWIFWCKMKITQADSPTIRIDCHPIQTSCCPHLCHPHHFYAGCPSWHNPPILSRLGTGTKYADVHTRWLGVNKKTRRRNTTKLNYKTSRPHLFVVVVILNWRDGCHCRRVTFNLSRYRWGGRAEADLPQVAGRRDRVRRRTALALRVRCPVVDNQRSRVPAGRCGRHDCLERCRSQRPVPSRRRLLRGLTAIHPPSLLIYLYTA